MLLLRSIAAALMLVGVLAYPAFAEYKRKYNPNFQIRGHFPEWIEVEADNGSIFSVDIKSIEHPFGRDPNAPSPVPANRRETVGDWVNIVEVVILGPDYEMMWYRFDCQGHAFDIQARMARIFVPPRSALGAIQDIVCKQ